MIKKCMILLCALLMAVSASAISLEQTATNEVVCSKCVVSPSYYYIWYILTSEDNTQRFYFAILVQPGTEDIVAGKEYTLADMDPEYSEWDDTDFESHSYSEASFVKTLDENGKMQIDATVTDDEGYTYHVVYDENNMPEIPAGGEYAITNISSSFFTADNDIFYALNDTVNKLSFYFDIVVENGKTDVESGKKYTFDEMLTLSCYGEANGQMFAFTDASFTKTMAADRSYTIEAEATDEKGNTWTLHYSNPAPRVREEVFTADSLTVQQTVRSWQITGYNTDSTRFISLYSITEDLIGHFNSTAFYGFQTMVLVMENTDTTIYDVKEADITITSPETEMYALTGTIVCEKMNDPQDIMIFTLDAKVFPPAPYVFPATLTGTDLELELMGQQWLIEGVSDEGLNFSIVANSKTVAGHYDASNLDNYYTYVSPEWQVYYDLKSADLDVTYADNTATLTGTMVFVSEKDQTDEHAMEVHLTARYTVPTERHYEGDSETAYEGSFDAYLVNDRYLDEYKALLVESANDEGQAIELLFYLPAGATSLLPGEYPVKADQSPRSVAASSGQNDGGIAYSFVGSVGPRGSFVSPYWFIVDGSVVVAEDGSIVVDALNSFGQSVYCVLAGNQQAVDNVQGDKVQSTKVLRDGMLIIEKNGVRYNAQGAVISYDFR